MLAYHTFKGLRERRLEVARDATQVSFLVEIALIAGDIFMLMNAADSDFRVLFFTRLPFLILTSINVFIVIYIVSALRIWVFSGVDGYLHLSTIPRALKALFRDVVKVIRELTS